MASPLMILRMMPPEPAITGMKNIALTRVRPWNFWLRITAINRPEHQDHRHIVQHRSQLAGQILGEFQIAEKRLHIIGEPHKGHL